MGNEIQVKITYSKGIHTRVAAMIVQKCQELMKKYQCRLFIKRERDHSVIPGNSMLALVSMKITEGETIYVYSDQDRTEEAVEAFAAFLGGSFQLEQCNLDEIDNIIQNNTLASEKVFDSIVNGLIVVDHNNVISVFNKAAERITGIAAKEALGKEANDIIDTSKLYEVLKTGIEQIAFKQRIGSSTIVTNRTPIIADGKIIGAVATFQDISELESLSSELRSVQDLQQRFQHILENVDDAICMLDRNGVITYVNPAYERIMKVQQEEVVNKHIGEVSPAGIRMQVLKEKTPQYGKIIRKENGTEIIANVSPILIDGEMNGVVSVSKEITEIKRLAEKIEELSAKTKYLQEELSKKHEINKAFDIIVGKSGVLLEALSIASKASETDATVLIRGESGTGKELVAKGIHYASSRKNKPFIRVNCSAIPHNLLESELFGYEKGAFTGAIKQKLGKFELADEGTIFLDEIGDMDKEMQAKLLRVLQERELERIGGTKTIPISVRVIAATNRNLEEMVEQGTFRSDLYYRLNVIPVMLPPLRLRKGDIPIIVEHLIHKICSKYGISQKRISKEALACMEAYNWPGNVRELENVIERALTLTRDEMITVGDLPTYIGIDKGEVCFRETAVSIGEDGDKIPTLEEVEKSLLALALKKHKSFHSAGKALGINHKTVAAKARKYNLI